MVNKILLFVAFILALGTFLYETLAPKSIPRNFGQEWVRTDFSKTNISLFEIAENSIPQNDFSTINNPQFIATKLVNNITPHEPVISVAINGDYRAYPLRFLLFHNVINDIVGQVPVTITYSPLTNTAIIYKREIDGELLEFAHTGKYRHANFLMYDQNSYSWWQQFTGEAIIGKMVDTKLTKIPSKTESFANFKQRAPNSKILVAPHSEKFNYGFTPYVKYDSLLYPPFLEGDHIFAIPAMRYVVAIADQAWLLDDLKKQKIITYNNLKIEWQADLKSLLDNEDITKARDIGNVKVSQRDQDGKYRDIPYLVTFVFAFQLFHPDGVIH